MNPTDAGALPNLPTEEDYRLAALRGKQGVDPRLFWGMQAADPRLAQGAERAQRALSGGAEQEQGNLGTRFSQALQRAQEHRQRVFGSQQLNNDTERLAQDAWRFGQDATGGGFMYNAKTGEIRHLDPQGFAPAGSGGPGGFGGKLTEVQTKAFDAALRMKDAMGIMDKVGVPQGPRGRVDAWATGASGPAPMKWLTPQEAASTLGQQYFTAARDLIAAVLRKESGAAITESEWNEQGPLYVPMPWDNPETVELKKRNLQTKLLSAMSASGPQASAYLQRLWTQPPEGAQSPPASLPRTGAPNVGVAPVPRPGAPARPPQPAAPPAAQPAPQGAPKRITNAAEYAALPPGTVYTGPDGVTRTKGARR